MRKWTLCIGIYFVLCMLAACAGGGLTIGQTARNETVPEERPPVSGPVPQPGEDPQPEGLSTLYLQVLDDLWKVDKALNSDVELIGLDLSATGLTEGERATVALLFGERHGVDVVQGTLDELAEQGYIALEEDFPHWENGCFFAIAEKEGSGRSVTFDAWKWRGALGAYFFTDCTAKPDANGGWTEYTIGAEAIS